MKPSRSGPNGSSQFWYAPVSALILWTCLWLNLNTGTWNILPPSSLEEWQLCIRAILPFIVLPVAGFLLLARKKVQLPGNAPSRLLMVYGIFAALAAIYSPDPIWSLYWSTNFLATILAAWTFVDRRNPVGSARQMLQVTWVATFIVAAIIGYQARNSVFGESASAYGVLTELNGLSRSSGVARWAAVPGLVCLVRAYHTRRFSLFAFFICASAVSFFIVYRMQSRGAIFGSAAALLFALLVSSRMRRYALPFAVVAILVILLLDSPATLSDQVATYLERGQSRDEFLSMTGRTRAYEHGLVAFEDAPLFGRGQVADRLIIGEHVHNSYLQALLNGGIAGGIPYFASWIAGWILFFRVQKRSDRLSPEDRICVLESGTVMMFFTVRAMPETTTASFAVDLLVMVAVYVYLESLTVQMRVKRLRQPAQPFLVYPCWMRESRKRPSVEVYPQI
jgi:O-antigen ligase